MKKFSTYLLVMFMLVFWILRIIITLASQFGKSFMGVVPINQTFEIVLLFVTLVCVLLIAKRNIIGVLLYLATNAIYYGGDITNKIQMITNGVTLDLSQSTELIFSMIGIILPIAVLLDWLLDKTRKANPSDKKTDWFYKNEQFDRELDERADKNNYRTM